MKLKAYICTDTEMDVTGYYAAKTRGEAKYKLLSSKIDCGFADRPDGREFGQMSVRRAPTLDYLCDKHNITRAQSLNRFLEFDDDGNIAQPAREATDQ